MSVLSDRPVVGLVGRKRVGKDTAASALVEELGFSRVAFADPVRALALEVNPFVLTSRGVYRLEHLVRSRGWERAKENADVRELLQNLGHGVRGLEPDLWVRLALERAAALEGPVVFTDVRYPNEADAIREAGGLLVRVTRPGLETGEDSHASEVGPDEIDPDTELVNDGSVQELSEAAVELVRGWLAERGQEVAA